MYAPSLAYLRERVPSIGSRCASIYSLWDVHRTRFSRGAPAICWEILLSRTASKLSFFLIYKHVLNRYWEDWQWYVWYLTYLTFAGKLRYCFLNSQISGCSRFWYFHTAIWASGDLVSESANETMKQTKALAQVSQLTKCLAYFEWNRVVFRPYLPSASRCVKHAAHIRWPIWHWNREYCSLKIEFT